MTLEEIKAAVDRGDTVCWHNPGYVVMKEKSGKYIVLFTPNNHCTGLTQSDGITLNHSIEHFYILNQQTEKS